MWSTQKPCPSVLYIAVDMNELGPGHVYDCFEGAMAHQGGGHAGECACCEACGDAEIALLVPQAPLCSLVRAQLDCTVRDNLQYLRDIRVFHMPVITHMCIADPSKCAAIVYHDFSAPLILSP